MSLSRRSARQKPTIPHIRVPMDTSGAMLPYPERKCRWVDNSEWEATLRIADYERCRSVARFILIDVVTGRGYSMYLPDLLSMMQRTTLVNGTVSGRWTFVKRGPNFGIRLNRPASNCPAASKEQEPFDIDELFGIH